MDFALSEVQLIASGFIITIIFNAGITWATMRQLRGDLNGVREWVARHEKVDAERSTEIFRAIGRLEGKLGTVPVDGPAQRT